MIRHTWSILCDSSVIDAETNTLSIRNIVEKITITSSEKLPEKAAIPMALEVTSFWEKNDKDALDFQSKVDIFNSSKECLRSNEFQLKFEEGNNRLRSRIKMSTLPFAGEGEYRIKVSFKTSGVKDWMEAADIPFDVVVKN
ncbi:MAG: hypothetical protein NUV56_00730 [Candidatus Uhrbacteria bacterium]|nr:hypothetical protein [Candidatus Uhrbacteria bacterium]